MPASPVADNARHLDTLGNHVRLNLGDEIVEGEALRVEDDGALVMCTTIGERVVTFGEIL